ncbi:MAG: glycosyltransferase family 4 protein [Pseudomonadota bacterium]
MQDGADILLFSHYFHPELVGSAPPITDLARFAAAHGVKTNVLTARPSYPQRQVFSGYGDGAKDHETDQGVCVRRLGSYISPKGGVWGRLLTEGSFALRALIYRMCHRPAAANHVISVCPSIFVVFLAGLFKQKTGRHVAIVHDIQSGLGQAVLKGGHAMTLLRWLERAALNRTDAIITLSDTMAQTLRTLGVQRPIAVLPPQVDTAEITPQPEASGAFTVLYSGAFGQKQDLDQVLSAAKALQEARSDIRFFLRGAGGVIEALEAQIAEDALHTVSLMPFAARDDINHAFAQAHVHLVPQASRGADFAVPSKIFSIMSAGRPFVATAHPGSTLERITAQSGAGLVVPPGEPKALAEALLRLQADDALRQSLGAAGRAYALKHADREVICPQILSLAINAATDAGF